MGFKVGREAMLEMTAQWEGDRFDDGRPRVPDEVLQRLQEATAEQVWSVLDELGYENQFEGAWRETRPGHKIVGRAVTARFIPKRPDLDRAVALEATRLGLRTESERQNWLAVDTLVNGDVLVVDIFGKVREGTVIGDKLGTTVAARSGVGAVIDGGIRDLEGIVRLEGINVFFRDTDPTAIRGVTLAELNGAVRIGLASVLPGDVVLGTATGVMFIPAFLAPQVAERCDDVRIRDEFGKARLLAGTYSTSRIDVDVWDGQVEADFVEWRSHRESRQEGGSPVVGSRERAN